MSMLEKNKNLFVITLDNGKQTYFDFADNTIYGLRGKPIQKFGAEAQKILKREEDNNFLAAYFIKRESRWSYYTGIRHWSTGMVETIYSLYSDKYPARALCQIAEWCYLRNYKLDKKGVKTLTTALQNLEEELGNLDYINNFYLDRAIDKIIYGYLPERIVQLVGDVDSEVKPYIVEDAEKINFRWEHEDWEYMYDDTYVYKHVARYIKLCNQLHYERTYKDLYLSICRMEKEKRLMAEKLCVEYQRNAPLFFEDDNYTILIPTTADEFKREADYQRNCVFRIYYPKVLDCETHVVFIRKKSDIDTPYITCEVNNEGEIIQYLAKCNQGVTEESATEFYLSYQHYLREHF